MTEETQGAIVKSPDLVAMNKLEKTLSKLTGAVRRRVLAWLRDKMEHEWAEEAGE